MLHRTLLAAALLMLTACSSLPKTPTDPQVDVKKVDSSPIHPGTHRYSFSWDGKFSGSASRTLSCVALACRYESQGAVPGLASLQESSDIQWQDGRAMFQRYERQVQLLIFPQTVLIERQGADHIRTVRKGTERRYAAGSDVYDLMSLELQIRADLLANKEPVAEYAVAQPKGLVKVRLSRLTDAALTLAGQNIHTRVYESRQGERITTLWLSEQHQWLPVQIVHQDGAETYRMEWLGN